MKTQTVVNADFFSFFPFCDFSWFHTVAHFIFPPFSRVAWYYVTQSMKSNFQPNEWFYRNNAPHHLYPLIRIDIRKSIPKFAVQVTNVHFPVHPFNRLTDFSLAPNKNERKIVFMRLSFYSILPLLLESVQQWGNLVALNSIERLNR